MSYEAVLEQVRATPEEYLDEISSIISLVVHRRKREEETAKSRDAFFSLAGKIHLDGDSVTRLREASVL